MPPPIQSLSWSTTPFFFSSLSVCRSLVMLYQKNRTTFAMSVHSSCFSIDSDLLASCITGSHSRTRWRQRRSEPPPPPRPKTRTRSRPSTKTSLRSKQSRRRLRRLTSSNLEATGVQRQAWKWMNSPDCWNICLEQSGEYVSDVNVVHLHPTLAHSSFDLCC